MKRPRTNFGLNVLIVVGICIGVAGVVLHLALPARYERVEIIPIAVGFGMALFGAYWKDPHRAERAARGVTHTGAEIVETARVWRGGTRRDDPVVDVTKRTSLDDPTAAPQIEVTVKRAGDVAPGPVAPEPAGEPAGDPATPPAVAVEPVDGAPGAHVPGEGP